MASPLATTKPNAAEASATKATSGFRLGEDQMSEASDTDQSAGSERSFSPSGNNTKLSKSKKKKARKQVGALTDELDTLLGAAFQAPKAASSPSEVIKPVDLDEAMHDDTISSGKKMSKRTRQNMLKAEARKRMREHSKQAQLQQQVPIPGGKMATTGNTQNQQNQTKKNATQARRQRKEKQRARRTHEVDAMEIG